MSAAKPNSHTVLTLALIGLLSVGTGLAQTRSTTKKKPAPKASAPAAAPETTPENSTTENAQPQASSDEAAPENAGRAKRLILTDGSYQLATKWEIKGDRVRYYSAERYAWEELPNSLVDWKATNDFNSKPQTGRRSAIGVADVAAADAEEQAERAREQARVIAPGVRLPDQGGVFVLDKYRGTPELVELVQNGGELNKQMGKNIMRAIINPLPTGARQSIQLKDPHARVQSHLTQPTIYVDIDTDDSTDKDDDSAVSASRAQGAAPVQGGGIGSTPSAPAANKTADKDAPQTLNTADRFKIVRLKHQKDSRVVSDVKVSLFGKMSEQQDVIPATAEQVNGGEWVKVTPSQPLQPGEYALVEMLGPKQINFYVWDFGVDPTAPENATAWKPAPVKEKPTGTDESPLLNKRPK